jgi:hypothetical protein
VSLLQLRTLTAGCFVETRSSRASGNRIVLSFLSYREATKRSIGQGQCQRARDPLTKGYNDVTVEGCDQACRFLASLGFPWIFRDSRSDSASTIEQDSCYCCRCTKGSGIRSRCIAFFCALLQESGIDADAHCKFDESAKSCCTRSRWSTAQRSRS